MQKTELYVLIAVFLLITVILIWFSVRSLRDLSRRQREMRNRRNGRKG